MPDHDIPPAAAATPPPPTAEGIAAALDRPDPFRATGDLEVDIPLHALDQAPWNPKPAISGPYRRGLIGSLAEFSLRARLIVWPVPRSSGRYYTIDGNQRLDVVREMAEDHLASHEAARRLTADLHAETAAAVAVEGAEPAPPLDLDSKEGRKRLKAAFEPVRADDAFMAECRARASSLPIPCRVLADLDQAGAQLFTATFDRNRAKFDEDKQARLVDLALAAKEKLGTLRESSRKRIELMTRPERPFVAPASVALPPPVAAAPPITAPAPSEAAAPGAEVNPDAWGEPPPVAAEVLPAQAAPTRPAEPPLVPVMFSLTAQAHAELTNGVLLSTQRMVRSTRLLEAVRKFVDCSTEADLSEAAVEIALVCLQRRINVAEDAAQIVA